MNVSIKIVQGFTLRTIERKVEEFKEIIGADRVIDVSYQDSYLWGTSVIKYVKAKQ